MPSKVLEVREVDKYYGKKRILHSLSFSLSNGECCTLLGPNGAGKTTLIKLICGLEKISAGNIRVLSHDLVTDRRLALRNLGVMPQDFNLNAVLNAKQILTLNGMYLGNGYRQSRKKADEIIDLLGLNDYRSEKVENLSGGRKRSLMLGKALVGSPKLLILDEPTAGIDISIKTRIFDHLRHLKKEGISILLVTHIMDEIEKVSDTIAVLKEGKISLHAPLPEIKLTSLKRVYRLTVDNTSKLLNVNQVKIDCRVVDDQTIEVSIVNENSTLDLLLKAIVKLGIKIFDIERVVSSLEEFAMESYR